jgi:UDP-N-acetylglucosamine diphosphorylase/glucosamine-1-phosphate N-acetyltransferase
MPPRIILFEDSQADHLQPLTLTRPAYDLRVGLRTIRDKWMHALGAREVSGPLRPHLSGVFPACRPGRAETLWINARYLPNPALVAAITRRATGHVRHEDDVVAAWADAERTQAWLAGGVPEPRGGGRAAPPQGLQRLRFPWDVFLFAGAGIAADAAALGWEAGPGPGWSSAAHVDRPERLFMHPTAVVEPGAMLVTDDGPIVLDAGSRVMAGAMVRGPVAVGAHATVRMGARIYGETVVGPGCKVGGEVANVVFHSYSNKAHEGYVGNSVFGQWVNLGADTTASNLKMTYGTVKLLDWPTGLEVDSGLQFLGAVMGDQCKTGINTMLNTGTVCGVSSIVVGAGFPAREIPSFKWVQPGAIVDYRLDKALVDMERMMARRGVALERPYRRMMEAIFALGRG